MDRAFDEFPDLVVIHAGGASGALRAIGKHIPHPVGGDIFVPGNGDVAAKDVHPDEVIEVCEGAQAIGGHDQIRVSKPATPVRLVCIGPVSVTGILVVREDGLAGDRVELSVVLEVIDIAIVEVLAVMTRAVQNLGRLDKAPLIEPTESFPILKGHRLVIIADALIVPIATDHNGASVRRHHVLFVLTGLSKKAEGQGIFFVRIDDDAHTELPEVRLADDSTSVLAHMSHRRHHQTGEQGSHDQDHDQFEQAESPAVRGGSASIGAISAVPMLPPFPVSECLRAYHADRRPHARYAHSRTATSNRQPYETVPWDVIPRQE